MNQQRVLPLSLPCAGFEGRNSVYLLPDDPITLIDTGIASDKAFYALVDELKQRGLSIAAIERVILTHKHVDHIGNAWRVQREGGAEILIHECELQAVTDVDPTGKRFGRLLSERMDEWRVPAPDRPSPKKEERPVWKLESAHAAPLVDGQRLAGAGGELEVLHTPGHTMGSICLLYGDVFFSGDHVLPSITPNIGGGDMRHRGLLQHYLNSLDKLRGVSDSVTVMPGHGDPFSDLANRVAAIEQHHDNRLNTTLDILRDGPQDVYAIAKRLFGQRMHDYNVVLGCAEAQAHLELLEDQGQAMLEGSHYRLA